MVQRKTPSVDEEVRGAPLEPPAERSLGALLAARARLDPERVAVRYRHASQWTDLTWGRFDARRRALAAGLGSLGVSRGELVAVVAHNSLEMLLADAALLSLGAVSVPLFPDSSPELLHRELADSGARLAIVGGAVQQHRTAAVKGIERVVVLDDQPLPEDKRALPLKAVEALGGAEPPEDAVGPDDLAFVLYTGGTTGQPKGVELTHGNVLAGHASMAATGLLSERDVFLASLPWHHTFGALFERFMALSNRALLALDDSRGRDLDRLLQNLEEVRPTVYYGVPRVFQALAARAGRDPRAKAAVFGGALRFVFAASSPLPEATFRVFEESGVPVLSGWGLTEGSPLTMTLPTDERVPTSVGWPLPGTAVRLDSAGVLERPGAGEALVRAPQVMRGYHNRPADTERALQGGVLHTGDLAEWTPHGLRLAGRVDGVFKLENGEKVSAGDVEARMLAASPLLDQCVALGQGQPFVTALCWLAPGPARRWLESAGLDAADYAQLTRVPELRRALIEALAAANLLSAVRFERVRRVALVPEPPSEAAGEVTPTLRMVRSIAAERHQELVDALREDRPHPQILDVSRQGGAFDHA